MIKQVWRLIRDFLRWSLWIYLFCGVCYLLFLLGDPVRWLLRGSFATPWGVFTSAFVHLNFVHLSGNIQMLLGLSGVLYFWNLFLPRRLQLCGGELMLVGLVSSALAVSSWLLACGLSGYTGAYVVGSSGVCGGIFGALIVTFRYVMQLHRNLNVLPLLVSGAFLLFGFFLCFFHGNFIVHFTAIGEGITFSTILIKVKNEKSQKTCL